MHENEYQLADRFTGHAYPRTEPESTATKYAYELNPGDVTGLGTVSKVVSGDGRTEIWFREYHANVSHETDSLAVVAIENI